MKRETSNYTKLLAAGLALALFPGAKHGCGSEEERRTWQSPVQAVTTVLEEDDGTVQAELVLISTAQTQHRFVDTARNVQLRVPGGQLVALPFGSPGHYATSSIEDPSLTYQAGATYRLTFELDDASAAGEAAGRDFYATADAPGDAVAFSFTSPPEFAHDASAIQWSPKTLQAMVTIRDPAGQVIFRSFDFENPTFSGDKWAHLASGGQMDLTGEAFPVAGEYEVTLCVVKRVSDFDTQLSPDLGVLSGFLIGRCAPPQTVTVAP